MNSINFKKIKNLGRNYKKIKIIFNNVKKINNKIILKKLNNEYKKIKNINFFLINWKIIRLELINILNLLKDYDLYNLAIEELIKINKKIKKLEKKFLKYLFKKKKKNNCFLEIRAGTGGNEAALFSKKIFKMYLNYFEIKKWNVKIININKCEYGGYKEIILKIFGFNAYENLKFESGGHRVQRIPETESKGRIHTSTCTIAILPEVIQKEINNINLNNIKIDTFKSSGAGGQHVNTTDSAVRITHIPTNIVVECQNERSQHKNKSKAFEVLIARIKKLELSKRKKKISIERKNLLGTGERSDRIRTYNFQKSRITDHRINLNLYCLEEIMNGDLDIIIKPLFKKYEINKLYIFLKSIN
ncbi:peptide chain release factor 1 [Enterobacterales bacterium endosymbiont of Anomoneura mori]|uniref:peptide chain release factor 1 n=1 Tax=Enterobacterales bacterium endosymbiont of Anomoneura mori TaxID=3132096 RepID=UPI00399C6BD6